MLYLSQRGSHIRRHVASLAPRCSTFPKRGIVIYQIHVIIKNVDIHVVFCMEPANSANI